MKEIKNIFLTCLSIGQEKMLLNNQRDNELDYDFFLTLSYISGIYAQEKDNIDFSDTVKSWLTDRLLNTQFRSFAINDTIYPRCRQMDFFTWGNDCSTTRFMYTEAQLVGGLALGNQEIFDEGIDSLQYITTFFDDKNIYTFWAARGIRAMGYHNQIPSWLTSYAVILDSVGYDFMEHEMPNGSKVHEAIKFSFDHVWEDDLSIFWPYIQINAGTDGNWTYPKLLKPMHKRGKFGLPAKPQKVLRQALRYVDVYQPELKDRFGYEEVYSKNITGTEDFYDVWDDFSWYAMYHLGSAFDMHSIYKASDKVFLAEQEACKASELDGEYIASWYLVAGEDTKTINDNKEPELQGSETLILDGCVGEFEGVESFQPSKELRKRLHVAYKPDGQITISGYLDLFDSVFEEGLNSGEISDFYMNYFTVLEGDLNSGEISDFYANGTDLIKIELINKAQLIAEEKRIAEAARIAEEKRIAACKVSELNGEYIATWYLVDGQGTKTIIDNQEPDFQGSETLILDGCVGEFEGVESFQPSKELRKNLQVSYKPNGQITVYGNLDLWEVGYSYPTLLKGDVNSGEISGILAEGDLIKIEIIKTEPEPEPEPEINWDAEDKLKGEYASKWYIGNAMDNPVTFEYRGKDALILERGKGVFSGVFSGMGYRFPSRDERGKLKIDYKPNGEITVEGDLGIFHNNKSYPTLLEGDINSGVITGVWAEGDLIKIEIAKRIL